MKRFWKGLSIWKTNASLLYAGAMTVYLFFCSLYGQRQLSLSMLWTLLAISAAGSLLQGICFSDWVIRKMRYTWRSALFVALFFPLLCLVAWKGAWFPSEHVSSWLLFAGLFFIIFAVMTAGFEIYYLAAGKKYEGLLGQYRREKEREDQRQNGQRE